MVEHPSSTDSLREHLRVAPSPVETSEPRVEPMLPISIDADGSRKAPPMPDLDEKDRAVDALVDLIGADVSRLVSGRDQLARQAAAAGLARCRRLLIGLDNEFHQGRQDLEGVFVRPLFETWLTSTYALWNPDGWAELEARARAEIQKLDSNARLGMKEIEEWETKAPYSAAEIAARLAALLKERGESVPEFPTLAYNLIFRAYSLRHAHGGAGPILGHLVDRSDHWAIREVRAEATGEGVDLTWCAMLVARLAEWVYEAFSLSSDSLRDAADGLGAQGTFEGWSYDPVEVAKEGRRLAEETGARLNATEASPPPEP